MVAPLCVMLDAMHEVFPAGNSRLVIVINEVHTTGTGVIWALKPSLLSRRKSQICLSCRTWSIPLQDCFLSFLDNCKSLDNKIR
jgi:hypothetical protein